MAYTQTGRPISIKTPLGKDALLLQGIGGIEGISSLYRFDLDLLAENPVSMSGVIGQKATVSIDTSGGTRFINGRVSRFAQCGGDVRFRYYRAEIVPWLWLLTRTTDCRIFQNKSTPEIIKQIFGEYGFQDFKDKLSGSYQPREYCVQYRETDFNFISRLMEEEGMFYFFEHEDGREVFVFADGSSAHGAVPGQASARFHRIAGGIRRYEDVVTSWDMQQNLDPGKYSHTDYNFEDPMVRLIASRSSAKPVGGNLKYEVYEYPGDYRKKDRGDALAKIRIEELECGQLTVEGTGTCRSFIPGYKFNLTEHPESSMNGAYVLTEVQLTASVGGEYTGVESDTGGYSNQFTCIPLSVPYRPRRKTPRPVIGGLQTAVVVGPADEEIYTDKYGRVKVQFHWDREGKKDENSSCWMRVSQPWAGKGWGGMWIPRIGQEVIVEHLEGDPDQPMITGRVYNAVETPPYKLPDHHTVSTFMSRSSKGGGSGNYNEIRFEDSKDNEQIFVNAEKDMDERVEHDSREYIGNDRHLIVHNNQFELVDVDKHGHVKGNHMEQVEKDMSLHVVGNLMEKIDQDMSHEVGQNRMEKVGSDMSVEVGSNRMEKVGSNLSIQVGSDCKEDVGSSRSLSVGTSCDEKVGTKYAMDAGQEIHLKGGMKVIIEAGMQVSLKGAGGFIDIGPAGVTIQGMLVKINSGGAAGSGSGSSPKSPDAPKPPKAPAAPTDPDTADDGSKFNKM